MRPPSSGVVRRARSRRGGQLRGLDGRRRRRARRGGRNGGQRHRRRRSGASRGGVRSVDHPHLERLRVRRNQALAVPGIRPGRTAVGLRSLQARGRARGWPPRRPIATRSSAPHGCSAPGGPCFPATILRLARRAGRADAWSTIRWAARPSPVIWPPRSSTWAPRESRPAGILHVAGGGSCSWYEFAREIVAGAGVTCQVSPCSTADMPRPATRPAYSVLRSSRGDETPVLADWREGLQRYMALRSAAEQVRAT